ncbi:MAG: YfiH family protein [Rickettsiales bacterium]|jgi:YfiH family protein
MIKYHFFGKECAVDKAAIDYSLIAKNLSNQNFSIESPIVLVNQIHGSEILVIDEESKIPALEKLPDADAIVTNIKNLNLAILTADCVPIVLMDEENSLIGAIHAGWKGAVKNITDNAIDEMLKIGAQMENIKAVIGPCIRQESYEIDEKFYENFLTKDLENKKFFIPSSKDNHFLFDLPFYVKEKLRRKGIVNIEDEGIDSYQEDGFFSYRRNTHLEIKDEMRNILLIQIN